MLRLGKNVDCRCLTVGYREENLDIGRKSKKGTEEIV
jgi:hypothetical protein